MTVTKGKNWKLWVFEEGSFMLEIKGNTDIEINKALKDFNKRDKNG